MVRPDACARHEGAIRPTRRETARSALRRVTAALLVGVGVVCAGACASSVPPRPVPDAEAISSGQVDAYREALALRASGRDADALEVLEPFVPAEPWHVPTHVLRQDLLIALGRTQEARGWYADAARAAPGDAARALLAARLVGDDGAREAEYARILAEHTDDVWASLAVAVAALRRAELLEARATALEDMGRAPDAEKLRREEEDAIETALRSARTATRRDPSIAEAHGVVSDALLAKRLRTPGASTDQAVAAARRATEADPWDARQFVRLARALHAGRDTAGAAAALERASALAPGDAAVLARLGRARLDQGAHAAARDVLERAAPVLAGDADVWHDLGVARAGSGDPEGAVDAFRRAVECDADEPRTHEALARALAATGRPDEAARAMEAYLAHGGRDVDGARAFIRQMRKSDPAAP